MYELDYHMGEHGWRAWVGAAVALIGSMGWLHESFVTTFGEQVRLAEKQLGDHEQIDHLRNDVRDLRNELQGCREKHE